MRKSTFFILCLEGAILSFNVAACAAVIPSVASDFSVSGFIAGRIIWLYMLPYGLAALIYGPLVRAFDAKKVELTCFSIFSFANLLAAFAGSIKLLFLARFLMGLFGASVIPLAIILISEHFDASRRGKMVGLFFSSTFIASLAGLLLSGIINWRMLFLIPAFLGFVLWVFIYFHLPSFPPEREVVKFDYLQSFKDMSILRVFSYIFTISFIYHGIQQWLGVYFSENSLNQFTISMLITLTSLSGIFGEAFGGRMSDSLGRIKTADLGVLMMIISAFILIFKSPLLILIGIMIIWGLGWTFNHAAVSTIITDLPKRHLNEAASLNSSVRFVSGGIGAALAGILMQKSFSLGFTVLGVCLFFLLLSSKKMLTLD